MTTFLAAAFGLFAGLVAGAAFQRWFTGAAGPEHLPRRRLVRIQNFDAQGREISAAEAIHAFSGLYDQEPDGV